MQPLDVSLFGPLTAAYCQLINNAAPHVNSKIDKAQFGSFYAEACKLIIMQMTARKAFTDSGISSVPDPEKVLKRLPGYASAGQGSGTRQMLLQEIAVPQSDAAVSAMLEEYRAQTDPRDARTLKRNLLQAFEEPHATISVLQAENKVLWAQEEQHRMMAKKVSSKPTMEDCMVLSRERMISRKYAEKELVAKRPAIAAHKQRKARQEEKRKALPPPVAVNDGNDNDTDGNEHGLTSSSIQTPLPMQAFLDELDNGKELSAIDDNDKYPGLFYNEVPHASSSRITL